MNRQDLLRPRIHRKPAILLFSLRSLALLFFLSLFPCVSFTPAGLASTEEEVVAKYEKAISLAQELNVRQEDIFHVVPKLRMAAGAVLKKDWPQAERILDEALADLNILSGQKGIHLDRTFRLQWLEIYRDIVLKYAVLALTAFLLVSIPYFRKKMREGHWSAIGKVYLTVFFAMSAIFLSLFDTSRYGAAAWVFFDIQVVLLTLAGLLGGLASGLLAGVLVGMFRWVLVPELWIFPGVALLAGLAGGVFSGSVNAGPSGRRTSLLAGVLAGALHGALVYFPSAGILSVPYILVSLGFLMVLEGGAVYVFFAIISGIIEREKQRELEKELLRTKLLFLQAQISPHFLFNALNTIAAICSREKAAEGRRLVLSLAEFFRRALNDRETITLREELSYIDAYLELEKARYQERLRIERKYDIPDELWNLKIPFLIIQPLVENAIKHGISRKEGGGTLTIAMQKNGKDLVLEISDDGTGADPERFRQALAGNIHSGQGGVGLQNIHERLVRRFGAAYGLAFQTREGGGTSVTIRFPLPKGDPET